ncbi:MAG: SUMF1/EgtB/PvdO family nonheme iron enzyme [Phycisphaerales bacterium]|nr:SUMF1/EgtB/PvdO family nonheme iron enzyme [Phycisphaerales bacterium]
MLNKNPQSYLAGGIAALMMCVASPAAGQVTFESVTIGNAGNAADPLNSGAIAGIGSVGYVYRIAKHEVTNYQYFRFLQRVAATDTNGLYNASMGSDPRGGITQSGSSGSFTYSPKANMRNKPVNYVSFFDAMRFVNWLHNGQPTGAQDASTTEAGVYSISDGVSETRAAGARFFIPTENEWYKAAYHQPSGNGGDSDDYWLYATASNSVPTTAIANATGDISNPGTNVVNYNLGAVWNGQTGNVTTVGSAGALSESFYGTSDQNGNLWEWNETVLGTDERGIRGGFWAHVELSLQSLTRHNDIPATEAEGIGFRVASPGCLPGQYDNADMNNVYSLVGCINPPNCPPCDLDPIFGCQGCPIDWFTAEFGLTEVGYSDWHLYSATCTGILEIHTCDTPGTLETKIDSVLGLYESVGTQTQGDIGLLASNDEGCEVELGGLDAIIVWEVQFGQMFGVRVAGYAVEPGASGLYTLTFTCNPTETASVPIGEGVTATIGGGASTVGGVSMTFDNVNQIGDVSADFAEVPLGYEPLVDINFQLPGDPTQIWNLSFSGTFTGTVELVFAYDESTLLVPETDLQIYHFDGTSWSALSKIGQDTAGNTITVETTSFSLFALGVPEGSGSDPIPAVSTWGLASLCLGLLAGGTLVLRQRRMIALSARRG